MHAHARSRAWIWSREAPRRAKVVSSRLRRSTSLTPSHASFASCWAMTSARWLSSSSMRAQGSPSIARVEQRSDGFAGPHGHPSEISRRRCQHKVTKAHTQSDDSVLLISDLLLLAARRAPVLDLLLDPKVLLVRLPRERQVLQSEREEEAKPADADENLPQDDQRLGKRVLHLAANRFGTERWMVRGSAR